MYRSALVGEVTSDMRPTHRALDNLTAQRPLQREDGSWNLAVIVDRHELSAEGWTYFDSVVKVATSAGVYCQEDWSRLPSHFDNVCVVAHNHPMLQQHLSRWGENGWFKGRYLILFVCGQAGVPPLETEQLFDSFGVTSTFMPVHQIEIAAVVTIVEALLMGKKRRVIPPQKTARPAQLNINREGGRIFRRVLARLQALWPRF